MARRTPLGRIPALDGFLAGSVQAGGQMMILISSMGQAIGAASGMEADPETIEGEIVDIVGRHLAELEDVPAEEDLQAATRVLRWATMAIGDNLFGPRPDLPGRSWVPEMRLWIRSLEDEPLPFDDEFPPATGELLN